MTDSLRVSVRYNGESKSCQNAYCYLKLYERGLHTKQSSVGAIMALINH